MPHHTSFCVITCRKTYRLVRYGSNRITILNIDESIYEGDDEMMYVLRRLKEAASDNKLRHDMNVKDEYFSVIEHRDTEILMRDKVFAKQNTQIAEQKRMYGTKILFFIVLCTFCTEKLPILAFF